MLTTNINLSPHSEMQNLDFKQWLQQVVGGCARKGEINLELKICAVFILNSPK